MDDTPPDPHLSFYEAGCKLPHDRLHRVGAGPSARGQQLHAYGPAVQHVAVLQPGRQDPHERRREGEIIWKGDVEQNELGAGLLHVLPQRRVFVHLVQLDVPVIQVVLHQLHRDEVVP